MAPAPVFPFNPDSLALEPVTIRSRIRAGSGEPVALKKDFEAEVIPGSGWEGHTAISGRQLINGGKAAQFEVSIGKPLTLAQCQALIIPRIPVPLKVTLFPDIFLPAPGVPVPVQAPLPPKTNTISVGIPEIVPGRIDIESAERDPDLGGNPRCELRARVAFPPFLHPTQDEIEAVTRTISFTEVSGQSAVSAGSLAVNAGDWTAKEYTAMTDAITMEGARVMVKVTARVCGIPLEGFAQLSFSAQKTYQPYIVPSTIVIEKSRPASFTATLRSVDHRGTETDVPDAEISVSVPADSGAFLRLSPLSAMGTLTTIVKTSETQKSLIVPCPVVFTAGKDRYEDKVLVRIGHQEANLKVVFDPEDKTMLNPYTGNDTITLKAQVRYPPDAGKPAGYPVITFSREPGAMWLDDPSAPVTMPDGWVAAAIGASAPDPESRAFPPESEIIVVRATEGGQIIAEEQVPIGLISPSLLEVFPDTVRLLYRGEDSTGTVRAKTKETVTLSVSGEHPGPWTFELLGSEGSEPPFHIAPAGGDATHARFTIVLAGELPSPDRTGGPSTWQQNYRLSTRASSGPMVIDGPDLTVMVLREGLFVEKIFTVNERNEYKTSGDLTVLPIRVDSPVEDRRRTARVKLVAMVWNGTELIPDEKAVKGKSLAWDEPVCIAGGCGKWETIFSTLKASLVCTDEDEPATTPYTDLFGTWGVSLDMIIPGSGEKLEGEVEVVSLAGTVKIPLALIFGERPDEKTLAIAKEKARCERIINGCIPKQYRQKLLDDLEKLPAKGAKDYQVYSRQVYDTAWRIWAEDQKDYQYWENGWGYYLFKGAEAAKGAGDIAFSLVIGYATSAMGPAWSYFASTMASEFKDQGLECYAYYVAHSDSKDFRTCVIDYVHENFTEFFIRLSSGAVDAVILQGIDIKNPKTYTRLAWLWLWKFEQNLARNPDDGIVDAMIAAGKEVAMVPAMMLLQEFVNVHGNARLKDLHKSVREKGYLGGKIPEAPEEKPGEKEKKPVKEKKPAKEKPGKEEKPVKDEKAGKKEEKPKTKEQKAYEKNIKDSKAKAQKDADDYINRGKEFVDPAARESFERGRAAGKEKLDRMMKASEELARNPDDPGAKKRFAEACEELQMDKHGMHELNDRNPNQQDKIREGFNEFWKGRYEQTDVAVRQRIADDLNRNLKPGEKPYTADDIEVAKVTNTPPKSPAEDSVKSTYDRDVTYRDKRTGQDVSTKISEKIYNEEFYRTMHNGDLPTKVENGKLVIDDAAVKDYAHKCDQTVTDRYSSDAYGGGKEDIPVAVDPKYKAKPFKDVEASAKAMEYKVEEWYDKAAKAEKSAKKAETAGNSDEAQRLRADAEGYKEEGMRQLTKQFKNQIEGRVDKMNELLGYPEKPPVEVPQELRPAIDIMNRVGTKGADGQTFTVADAEAALKQTGTTPQEVSRKMSGVMESAQKNTPPEIKKVVDEYVRGLDAEERELSAPERFEKASESLRRTLGVPKKEEIS